MAETPKWKICWITGATGGIGSELSGQLAQELVACLGRGEQSLVLRNRRGWATALHCPTCGERVQCARCALSLTWHRSARRLRCHTCGFEQRYPDQCPTCGSAELNPLGEGTEKTRSAAPVSYMLNCVFGSTTGSSRIRSTRTFSRSQ